MHRTDKIIPQEKDDLILEQRKLGIIGGVSWYSTARYYQRINEYVGASLGREHSARLVINSLEFSQLLQWQSKRDQIELVDGFVRAGKELAAAGCSAFAIASHTLSFLGEKVASETGLEHISLYSSVMRRLSGLNAKRIGLIGTLQTMTEERYAKMYKDHGYQIVVPDARYLKPVARVVYRELTRGEFKESSRKLFFECFDSLIEQQVDAIVLGCTEIGLLTQKESHRHIPLIDLIEVHADDCFTWICRKC